MSGPAITLGARALARGVREGSWTAEAVLDVFAAHIERADARVKAWRRLDLEGARAAARKIDARRAVGGPLGPLAGVPIGLKDNFVTEGLETGAGSRILEGWVPGYDGTHAQRLRAADALLVGKLAMDEFAMGSSNENTPYAPVRNPWAPDFVPGGSSGGSAAAVAARMCPLALGSDTGGSIRQPASLCGVYGLKPSYGRVTRSGMIAFASSLDQAGPLAHDIEDLALGFRVIAGPDPLDASCVDLPVPTFEESAQGEEGAQGLEGLRLGIHRAALDHEGLDPAVREAFDAAIRRMVEAGAELVDIELPHFELAIACYYVICTAEAASNLARYDGLRYGRSEPDADLQQQYRKTRAAGFGDEVKRRIMLGTYVLRADSYEAYYGKAMRVRRRIANDYAAAFERCDVLLSPVSPVPGFRRGDRVEDPLAMYLSDVYTIGVNLAGLPALSVPCGHVHCDGAQLPVGFQVIGRAFDEATLFRVGRAYAGLDAAVSRRPPWIDEAAGDASDAGGETAKEEGR